MAKLQCLGKHETGLRHGAFGCIYQQENAVNHFEHTLYLAAEIGMARGVYDIDLNAVILNGGILCENCDSSFTLDVVGIHYSVFNFLIFSECAALLEHFINEVLPWSTWAMMAMLRRSFLTIIIFPFSMSFLNFFS